MGTRNLIMVKSDNKTKVAQYSQWDGYPTGQGKRIAKFIHMYMDLSLFKRKINSAQWIKEPEFNRRWESIGADESGFVDMEQSAKFKRLWPELHRDTGADVLARIQRQPEGIKLQNSRSFLKDHLYCEYAYMINLDNQTVTVIIPGTKTRRYKYTFEKFTIDAMNDLEKKLNGDDD